MRVHNVHRRRLTASPAEVGALLDGLASDTDGLWPTDHWPAMRLDRPLGVGAAGGHGPVRYTVVEYTPGERVRFRFSAPRGFDGFHELTVVPEPDGGAVLGHLLRMRARGPALLTWPLLFRPFHDALLEDGLDRAERTLTGTVRTPARWGWYVRLLRRAALRTSRTRHPLPGADPSRP
ncbi:SRPBCC family protein [Nocardiopsis lambiniae]|uniref:SRPBCC family protein n=1 Tax=Nocardiopsis lambiniae TaxID=3075539 RepID=A0ABU2MBP4_9ACTN|nr:SRPBCC family protein [Nocardiopsis sp. DSM 44743]MDT0329982.1 SRPBCC family protein [Nocardiopsis sp. DSM 44743]